MLIWFKRGYWLIGHIMLRWRIKICILRKPLRLARAATRRNKFVSIGYHGSSVLFAHRPQNRGVPKVIQDDRIDVEFGDMNAIKEIEDKIAAVIVEVPGEDERAQFFLWDLRRYCDDNGAVLILDDIVTGFRLALGGAGEHYKVNADLVCLGKAMANGRGISAFLFGTKLHIHSRRMSNQLDSNFSHCRFQFFAKPPDVWINLILVSLQISQCALNKCQIQSIAIKGIGIKNFVCQ